MNWNWRALIPALALLLAGPTGAGAATEAGGVKIGVLGDLSGPYSSITGMGSVAAARLAIEDMGGTVLGQPVELEIADHQHKPDLGSSIARRWYDADGVDAIFDIYNSGVALAVQRLATEKNKILISSVNSAELTGKSCSPNGFQWGTDGYSLATLAVKGQADGNPQSWFFLTVDYTAGHSLEKDASRAVNSLHGKVAGAVRFPLGTTDFSSYLLQAQGSKADNIALISGGSDTLNAIKQAEEFQVRSATQKLIPLSLSTADILALGNQTAAGFPLVLSFYWDADDGARAWTERFRKAYEGRLPTDLQANVYSAVLHYLRAVQAAGTTDSAAVREKLVNTPVNDFFTPNARVRADGRLMRELYYAHVNAPDEMKDRNDLVRIERKFSGEESFIPPALSECPLLKEQIRTPD